MWKSPWKAFRALEHSIVQSERFGLDVGKSEAQELQIRKEEYVDCVEALKEVRGAKNHGG